MIYMFQSFIISLGKKNSLKNHTKVIKSKERK